ncbi:MAG: hypothetical protein ACLPSF_10210 [Methylocella sp.]
MFYELSIAARDIMRKSRAVQTVVWRTRKAIWRAQILGQARRPIVEAGPILSEAVRSGRPLAAGKMGLSELKGLLHFLKRAEQPPGKKTPYSRYVAELLYLNAGVFPRNDELFDQFGAIFRDAVTQMDILCSWNLPKELMIFNRFAPNAALTPRISLDAFYSGEPWTSTLEGKRVLVISPFIDSIRRQYARRTLIWKDPRILPEFTLYTVRTPLSAGLVTPVHKDWVAALDDLKGQMDALDYDVALIGAGAFSLALATHAKARGRIGVHLGGTTQFLFGVYGGRWKDKSEFQAFINEDWIRPGETETPQTVQKIENGCYW